MENRVKRYDMVNVLRMVCAYLVIVIHFMGFQSFGDNAVFATSQFICRIAVPFFFLTSGYFFYSKVNKEGYLKKYLINLIKIYLIGTIVYSIVQLPNMYPFLVQGGVVFTLKLFLVNSISGAMWYFPALILSIIVVYVFLKKDMIKPLIVLSVLLLILAVMGDSYYGLIKDTALVNIVNCYNIIFDNTRNGITIGVPFLTIGALINKYSLNEKIKKPLGLLIAFFAIFAIEAYLLISNGIPMDYNIYLSLVLVVPIIFIMALNSKLKISDKASNYMREMSVWIYVFHNLIAYILFLCNINVFLLHSLVRYLIICVISTLLAYVITAVKFRNKNFNETVNNIVDTKTI